MKKNMILVIILALLVVNIVLTAITMFSITSTNKKTAAVVADIATALSIEMASEKEGDGEEVELTIADIATYPIADQMTIQLRDSVGDKADGKSHYCMVSVVLSMNTQDPDYKTYSETIANNEGLIKNEINEVIGAYTMEEAKEMQASGELKNEVTARLQALYNSKFIYDVSFPSIMFQ